MLINGINALLKKTPRDALHLLPWELTAKKQPSVNKERAFIRQWICWSLDLGLLSYQNCEKQVCVISKSPSLWYLCYSSPNTYCLALLQGLSLPAFGASSLIAPDLVPVSSYGTGCSCHPTRRYRQRILLHPSGTVHASSLPGHRVHKPWDHGYFCLVCDPGRKSLQR